MDVWISCATGFSVLFFQAVATLHFTALLASPRAGSLHRGITAVVAWAWLSVVLFHSLAVASLYTRFAGLVAWFLVALLLAVWSPMPLVPWDRVVQDMDSLRGEFISLYRGDWGVIALIASGQLLVSALVWLVAPPYSWDSLTYHLIHAGVWIQEAGYFNWAVPDNWGHHQFLPANGEILSSWWMLAFRDEAPAAWGQVPTWCLLLAVTMALAREFGATPESSRIAGVLVATTPAVFHSLGGLSIDLAFAGLGLAGIYFLVKACRQRGEERGRTWTLGMMAAGLAVGTRHSGLPLFGLSFLILIIQSLRGSHDVDSSGMEKTRTGRWLVTAIILGLFAGSPWYIRNYLLKGSPLYPIPVKIGSWTLSTGSASFEDAVREVSGLVDGWRKTQPWVGVEAALEYVTPAPNSLGPLALMILVLPLVSLRVIREEGRGFALFLGVLMAGTIALVFASPSLASFRILWAWSYSRLILLPFAFLVATGVRACETPGLLGTRIGTCLKCLAILNLVQLNPLRPYVLTIPISWTAALLCLVLFGRGLARMFSNGLESVHPLAWVRRPKLFGFICVLFVISLGPPCLEIRAWARPRAYAAMPALRSSAKHVWDVWTAVDRNELTHRIAVAAGFGLYGTNWIWAPLLGRHLQNRLLYVPVSQDGSIVSYRNPQVVLGSASYADWRSRLEAGQVDTLVTLPPDPIEAYWALKHPESFEALGGSEPFGTEGVARVFRFHREPGSSKGP